MLENYRQRAFIQAKRKKESVIRIDYTKYSFSGKELLKYVLEGCLVVVVFGYFFYRAVWAMVLLSPLVIFYLKNKKRSLCRIRKNQLATQFKDTLNSVNGSIQAGYSLENAFCEAYRDMSEYHGSNSVIARELLFIKRGLHNNQTLEDLLEDLAKRSGIDDISDFAGVLRIGKSSGGNIDTIFENCITVIEDKITVHQEIETLISAKKLENLIMCIIPFFIIFYVDITSKGYFDVMYETMAGRVIMSICLGVYLMAYYLGQRIMEIEV